jgi:hypothetical protein
MGVTPLYFSNFNVLPKNIIGCALSPPDGSSLPRLYFEKDFFEYRLKI